MGANDSRNVFFTLGGMTFEYDIEKNKKNIRKHGISFKSAARVFFDYDRIEYYDEENSIDEDRYNIIGDLSAGNTVSKNDIRESIIGKLGMNNDILFVVYTERIRKDINGFDVEVIRLISARIATNFERGLYYGKNDWFNWWTDRRT